MTAQYFHTIGGRTFKMENNDIYELHSNGRAWYDKVDSGETIAHEHEPIKHGETMNNKQIELLTGRFKGIVCTVIEENEKVLKARLPSNGMTISLPKDSNNKINYYKEVSQIKGKNPGSVVIDEIGEN